ncbi:TetR/AcrR family transcriptional repressor of nem operon [Actinoplanes octamycinicus]|uniref:TetR/AcrR family transcriptional repressor of nem operon n=1 Tax=Actinoplanes octamycinicus TaxID=135948 RepID=A0A7W7H1X5_9ACTN|nr:TetR/AcrR family transcriptional regulator [Actinoplanes octamycinicus]MBB4742304.1 TetR/AcrR family transcriptional repressor of nem operon [Actinoplanes octamycinicus]GIE59851.1 TetR family transcriptional regulator [Actinoplanes octamycinicus]
MARDTRERIVAVARDLVHGASLAEVSTEDVCKAAGVHKGSLYHFFPSKEALGGAVLDHNWDMMHAVLEESFADDVPPLERVDRFVDSFVRMLTLMRERFGATPGCPLGGLAAEVAGHGDEGRARAGRVLAGWMGYFATAISEAKGRGDVPADVDPRLAATRVLALMQGLTLLAKAHDDPGIVLLAKADIRLLLRASG